jgi:hypothetical protein
VTLCKKLNIHHDGIASYVPIKQDQEQRKKLGKMI